MPWLSSRPVGLEQVAQALGVRVDLDVADVLDHADRGDRVEALAGQLAPVLHADVDAVGDAGLLGARAGALGLRRRQRDAGDVDAVVDRGVHGEAAPAAADVEQALAGLEAELGAHELELGLLGLLERRGPAREDRAAVGHRLVEEEREELRPEGRSGGAPSGGRARSSAGAPRARARTAGARGGRSRPIARAAASARRALVARSSVGGFQVCRRSIVASMSSTSSSPET